MKRPAHEIAAGTLVLAELGGSTVLCLKAERVSKDYVNHYLVPLDPVADRRALALVYLDPEQMVAVAAADGRIVFGPTAAGAPEVGDAFAGNAGSHQLKVLDDPRAQKLFAYVDLATGTVRGRLERGAATVVAWRVERAG